MDFLKCMHVNLICRHSMALPDHLKMATQLIFVRAGAVKTDHGQWVHYVCFQRTLITACCNDLASAVLVCHINQVSPFDYKARFTEKAILCAYVSKNKWPWLQACLMHTACMLKYSELEMYCTLHKPEKVHQQNIHVTTLIEQLGTATILILILFRLYSEPAL